MSTKELAKSALFAAIISVFSVITIKIGVVPITLSVFAVLLTAVVAGAKVGTAATLVYILIGAVGLPVFSGFRGGISVLAGPTGGYIISYIFMAIIVGAVSNKTNNIIIRLAACVVSVALCYALGTVQYMIIAQKGLAESLIACVYPFIAVDLVKCAAAVLLGGRLKKLLP